MELNYKLNLLCTLIICTLIVSSVYSLPIDLSTDTSDSNGVTNCNHSVGWHVNDQDKSKMMIKKVSKRSGISDQRLAELEALLALRRRDNALRAQTAMGFTDFDLDRIGKRKRREKNVNYQSTYYQAQPDDYLPIDLLVY